MEQAINSICSCLRDLDDWTQSFLIKNKDNTTVDLGLACGTNPVTPPNSLDQPSKYPYGFKYCFDPRYNSPEHVPDLLSFINEQTSCTGCTFITRTSNKDAGRLYLTCTHALVNSINEGTFEDGKMAQSNIPHEQNKVRRGKRKRRTIAGIATMHNKTDKRTIAKETKRSQTNNNGDDNSDKKDKQKPKRKRTQSDRSPTKESRCKAKISIYFHKLSCRFYLSTNSNMTHRGHPYISPKSIQRSTKTLNASDTQFTRWLYEAGVTPQQQAEIMNKMSDGKTGGSYSFPNLY